MLKKIPAIPAVTENVKSIVVTTSALKEAVELMSGQTGGPMYPTWDDLVRLGICQQADVPR